MLSLRTITVVVVVLGMWAAGAAASGSVVVEHAGARASPKGAPNGAAYFTVVSNGSESDRLIGASSPVAENIQFHEERDESGGIEDAPARGD